MDFLSFLTPPAEEVLALVRKAGFRIHENIGYCRDSSFFGFVDHGRKFVICTANIRRSGLDMHHYTSETVLHEAVHVAQQCNNGRPFGLAQRLMALPANKMVDVSKSRKLFNSAVAIEHEAYWMEDKPNEVRYVMKKYCL